jgi:hypothetical protein
MNLNNQAFGCSIPSYLVFKVKQFLSWCSFGLLFGIACISAYILGGNVYGCKVIRTTNSRYGVLDQGGVKLDYNGHTWSYVANDGRHVAGYSTEEDSTVYNYERCLK